MLRILKFAMSDTVLNWSSRVQPTEKVSSLMKNGIEILHKLRERTAKGKITKGVQVPEDAGKGTKVIPRSKFYALYTHHIMPFPSKSTSWSYFIYIIYDRNL